MTDASLSTFDDPTSQDLNYRPAIPKIAIIGGGLTGLFTAALLEREFAQNKDQSKKLSITIFEKSRSVGRLATRYRTDEQTTTDANRQWQWAFGAQFFTAKSVSFSKFIEPWLESGLLQPWRAHVVDLTPADKQAQAPSINYKEQWDSNHARYISTPKMSSWGRALADNLQYTTIKFKTRVAPLAQYAKLATGKPTELFDENGNSLGPFDWIICTAPNTQAADLMVNSGFDKQAQITQPQMLACYTLMLGWDHIDKLPEALNDQATLVWDVAYMHSSILARIFIEHQKPARDNLLPSITIHARNEWSEQQVDDDIETIQAQLLAAAKQALNWNEDTAPSQIDCHRWRYASTIIDAKNKPLGILVDNNQQWIVSGDWCGQGNIESCYQMAEETIEMLRKVVFVS